MLYLTMFVVPLLSFTPGQKGHTSAKRTAEMGDPFFTLSYHSLRVNRFGPNFSKR